MHYIVYIALGRFPTTKLKGKQTFYFGIIFNKKKHNI